MEESLYDLYKQEMFKITSLIHCNTMIREMLKFFSGVTYTLSIMSLKTVQQYSKQWNSKVSTGIISEFDIKSCKN